MTTATDLGLIVTSEKAGKTYYEPVFKQARRTSDFNAAIAFAGLDGFWEPSEGCPAIEMGQWYKLALATKPKTGQNAKPGSLYMDIVQCRLATPDEIPEQSPQEAQNGGSSYQDDYRRSKEEMRWTEALHMAVVYTKEGTPADIEANAYWFYDVLCNYPGYPQEAPEANGEPTPERDL